MADKIAQQLRDEVETLIAASTILDALVAQSRVAELALAVADRKALELATKPRNVSVGDQHGCH